MSNKGLSKETTENHESFGMVGITCPHSSGTYLFGSEARHHNYITLTVKRAEVTRHLSNDWYHASSLPLVEIELSHSQFAQLITSPGMGDGVPCTIRGVNGKMMAACPEPEGIASKFSEDLKATTKAAVAELVALRNQLNESLLPGNKPLNKTEQRDLLGKINSAIMSITSSIPFIESSFNDELEKKVDIAKAEVEATAARLIHRTGLYALDKAKQMIDAGTEMPEFPQLGEGPKSSK
jgi:hypothetical protein